MLRTVLVAAMLAASLGGVATPAAAYTVIYVREAPPPLRVETIPDARRGYAWVPGYWNWRGERHVWVKGAWMRDRSGYRYDAPRWHEHDGRWVQERGRWSRNDRDGDGVPNRLDRQPDNPRRH